MKIIDAHHHFWDLEALDYPWLEAADKTNFFGSYAPIAQNYLPEDYRADTKNWQVVSSVHVQAECRPQQAVAETQWLSRLDPDLPGAIVAYADLAAADAEEILARHCDHPRVRGVRQIVNYHPDPRLTYTLFNLLDDDAWQRGFHLLRRFDLSFDLQLYPAQMAQAAELARVHDEVQLIVNHTGMPVERDAAGLERWRSGMAALAACPNVAVKISGLGMTDPHWTVDTTRPFVRETLERFGVGRCLFASNFPVDRLFSSFDTLFGAFDAITADLSASEREALFHDNAQRLYRL